MSQESFHINHNLLKHLRKNSGKNSKEVADNCHICLRQYQRIEQTGKTTKKNALHIAKEFDVTLEMLQGRESYDKSPWFIKSRDAFYGRLTTGYEDTIAQVTDAINIGRGSLNNDHCILLDINDKELPYSLKITYHPGEYGSDTSEWLIRPAIINELGIHWVELDQWQRSEWESQIKRLSYSLANQVVINNKPLVPEASKVGFHVHFERLSENGDDSNAKENEGLYNEAWLSEGTQFFQKDVEFRSSLTVWMQENMEHYPFPVHPSLCAPGALTIFFSGSSKRFTVTRAWLDESGQAHQAPWPELQREQLADALESFLKKPSPLPIAIGELGPEHFPPLAPVRETEVSGNH
ncbi:MAG: helix-turn-helix transcriptional regulator [Methylophaga sp.]|uniref:helix-turn-helix domain-containing protein n=1 Tax=Methylophaga sp. TaxID=2024840 RepID=UPI00299DADA0|nr:helix-turn-helix transcriptional regulator [Methylophaga sp.]MDX1751535.1 helix-turn-helix transcriptional regulator [Methylophaga sp.]